MSLSRHVGLLAGSFCLCHSLSSLWYISPGPGCSLCFPCWQLTKVPTVEHKVTVIRSSISLFFRPFLRPPVLVSALSSVWLWAPWPSIRTTRLWWRLWLAKRSCCPAESARRRPPPSRLNGEETVSLCPPAGLEKRSRSVGLWRAQQPVREKASLLLMPFLPFL